MRKYRRINMRKTAEAAKGYPQADAHFPRKAEFLLLVIVFIPTSGIMLLPC